MNKQLSSSRISSIGYFSKIVRENHQKWSELDAKIEEVKYISKKRTMEGDSADFEQNLAQYEEELAKISFVIIIFTAIAVEAYIYDYAARNLGDSFVKDHLDKLDTVSKWLIIPELVTGNKLPKRQHWHGELKKLIKARNSLIHYKSWDPSSLSVISLHGRLAKSSIEVHQAAGQSIDLLRLLADKISEIDPEETPWVQSHLM